MKTCPVCDTPFPDQHAICPADGAVLIELRELEPGHIVRGKYRIMRKLGAGGMGVVYLAEHQMLGGQVALKFLAVELSQNPKFIKRFRREARAAYQLRDPNIVEVVDLDQDEDGSLFIAMEYVNGPSLRWVLEQAPRGLPVRRALHIARGMAAGLAAAHARGAIHRDIKPENILLGRQADGSELPKVLDFGIATMTEGLTNLSNTRGLLLTPEYAAPEQWRGMPAAELDGRTDLYALGVVLYEMLAGRTPYQAENMEGWMYQHLQGVPQPLERFRPELA
jgi:serine/threonine-protein kinase